jgi:CHAT domain-containing protein
MGKGFDSRKPKYKDYRAFLDKVLKTIKRTNCNRQAVERLLRANLDKLDDKFAQVLRNWAMAKLPELESQQAQYLAGNIGDFSNLIKNFPLGNWADNREIAITGYEVIATIFTREALPQKWATLQNQLGHAYLNRIQGKRAENLETAITYFNAALEVYKHEDKNFREQWATIRNNLGEAYRNRIRGEKPKNLETAITYFKAALEVHTLKDFPQEWVRLQNNLGLAYSECIWWKNSDYLEAAIDCYLDVLKVCAAQVFLQEWADAQRNLGDAYRVRLRTQRENEKIERWRAAIDCYLAALHVYKREDSSEQWAVIQNNLGNAYFENIWEKREEYREAAIRHYLAALEVYTPKTFRERWARIKNNLGLTYIEIIKETKPETWEVAISCFKDALEVRTSQAFPENYIETQYNLGLTYQAALQFSNAYAAFATAIDTVESRRVEMVSGDGVKQKLAEQYHRVYQQMVEVCIKLGDLTKAIEYVERSKARNLIELLATKNLYPKRDLYPSLEAYQTHCNQLDQLHREIPAKQRKLEILTSTWESEERYRDEIEQRRQELNYWQQQQDELIREINQVDSRFTFTQKVEPIPFSDIQALTDDRTAIVQWYITGTQILTFIITRHHPHPFVVSSSAEDMKALEGWDKEYRDVYRQQKKQWIDNLAPRLQHLAEILHIDHILSHIDDIFEQKGARCDRLILIPHRYLHLFPLHALPLADGNLLLDRFPKGVGYAPSCQLLKLAKDQERHRPHFSRLFAIQNPTRSRFKPLLGSKLEVDRIRQHFDSDHSIVLAEAEATEANINQRMSHLRSAHCVHFSCHGVFKPESPLESALLLADPEDKLGEDANLTLGKIFEKLYLNQCRLVTFSACESGMTDPTSISDEYIGLPSGFLYAGSLSIVSTLWTVDPLATTLLMVKFYKNLKRFPELKAGDVSLALKKAQTWLRTLISKKLARIQNNPKFQRWVEQAFENLPKRDRNKFNDLLYAAIKRQPCPFANPYYWSAFVATGL